MANLKLPNGYGSVFKLSGKRRKPYVARKTIGWDDRAFPIYSVIGYYPTRKDAMIALAEYNADPYDIDLSKMTFSEVYDAWSKERYPKMKSSLKSTYIAAYKHCRSLHDLQYSAIRKLQMQRCIDACERGYATKANIKLLLTQLDKFAYDQDIISKSYSKNLDVGEKMISQKHTLITDEEVQSLWKLQGKPYVDDTLFMLYTGCRMSEMLQMKCANVDIENNTMIGGIKTQYGINRTIPIHQDILPIVKKHLSDAEYLFDYPRSDNSQDAETALSKLYGMKWKQAMKEYGFHHLTHDCRHTFRSKLDSAGANQVAIDRIMGHSSKSLGEKIYTHKTVKDLQDAINLLSYGPTSF